MCDCSKKEKQYLTNAQVEEGRKIIKNTLIAFTVGQRDDFERIFSESNPRHPGPSVVQYGKIAYCAKPEDKDNHVKRTRTSLGRYLNRQEGIKMGVHIENACNAAMAAIAHFYQINDQFEILRGEDLKMAYKKNVGGGSCMSGSDNHKQDQLNFYAINPDRVGLLVWAKKRGRALIWTLPDGTYYIDRIYSGDGNAYKAYETWAAENGVKYSFEGELDKTKPISSNPASFEMELHCHGFPYFDTLEKIDTKTFTLGGRGRCDRCGEYSRREDSIFIHQTNETVCQACYDSYYATCVDCDENYLCEDGREIVGGDMVCTGCAIKYTECAICCILYSDSEIIEASNGDLICENCCSSEGFQQCPHCNEWKQEEFDAPEGSFDPVCEECFGKHCVTA